MSSIKSSNPWFWWTEFPSGAARRHGGALQWYQSHLPRMGNAWDGEALETSGEALESGEHECGLVSLGCCLAGSCWLGICQVEGVRRLLEDVWFFSDLENSPMTHDINIFMYVMVTLCWSLHELLRGRCKCWIMLVHLPHTIIFLVSLFKKRHCNSFECFVWWPKSSEYEMWESVHVCLELIRSTRMVYQLPCLDPRRTCKTKWALTTRINEPTWPRSADHSFGSFGIGLDRLIQWGCMV